MTGLHLHPMGRLPLFPLPVVLFPGGVMPLHIFEQRYRDMVEDCLGGGRRFGLLYHDPDVSGPFLFEEGRVGCVAEITEHQPLDDGRSLILVEGRERFRLRDGVESTTLYYEAVADRYVDTPGPGAALRAHRGEVVDLFFRLLEHLPDPPSSVPEFDLDLDVSFSIASVVQVDPVWQQRLLEITREEARLDRLEEVFRMALSDPDALGRGPSEPA